MSGASGPSSPMRRLGLAHLLTSLCSATGLRRSDGPTPGSPGTDSLMSMLSELVFVVEEAPEGGYIARALGEAIFTEADDLDQLRAMVRDAVMCHFEDEDRPKVLRLHLVHDELLAV